MAKKIGKIISIAFLSLLIFSAAFQCAWAQDKKADLKVYQKFFKVTGTEAQYNQILNLMIAQLQQGFSAALKKIANKMVDATPEEREKIRQLVEQAMGNYFQRMRVKITEIMPLTELISDVYYPVYSKHFTISEIEELIVFFESPLGQKYISAIPNLMQESVIIMNQKYTPKLEEISFKIVEEEMDKIRPEIEKLKKDN